MISKNSAVSPLLVGAFWPEKEKNRLLRLFFLVVSGSLLLAISAKIQVPFWPVPITMQTMVVLILGMSLGWRLGGAAYMLYIVEGACGLPVFAGTPEKGIGLTYILGPTGGYLLGMFFACLLVGKCAERAWDRNIFMAVLAFLIGNALIYIPGLLWLGTILGWDKPILEWGLYPFLYGDIVKIALGALLMPSAWKLMKWVQKK